MRTMALAAPGQADGPAGRAGEASAPRGTRAGTEVFLFLNKFSDIVQILEIQCSGEPRLVKKSSPARASRYILARTGERGRAEDEVAVVRPGVAGVGDSMAGRLRPRPWA